MKAKELIEYFDLKPHVEGGYFNEDFRSDLLIPGEVIDKPGIRSIYTSCYYLLAKGDVCIFHKMTSDEIWNFCYGGPLELFEITENGEFKKTIFGSNFSKGELVKYRVIQGNWFGARLCPGTEFCFFNCSVFPGFDFEDWEKGDSAFLKSLCPEASEIIDSLT